ncbi:glycyl-tRNA synthetase [Pseudovirgaria hyperparasitica]|uniref:glycine--tRNA ligase n=1 Tax=Pseudovirgaria hyperparasitica TaxID=470096 RepID=A0A6A6W084_9PEZI|nr:glycyl-tRNA synthetase [Pseudovirgaria hyperparasitica]KAF2755549.1 glycyl-tRNA synthetase [Pseudovirgaria hyperparasitica]
MPDTIDYAGRPFDRVPFESVLRRRFFFTESFESYRQASGFKGDNRGLFDYGPPGCALQANIVALWRQHFVLEEEMLELDCTALTPEDVFKTSGHVDKFADWMCKDPVKGEYLRADHLVENVLEGRLKGDKTARGIAIKQEEKSADAKKAKTAVKDVKAVKLDDNTVREYEEILAKIDNYDGEALGELIKRFDIRNPDGNNEVQPPIPFNLMFKSSIGPSAAAPVYLRPETAQGQFLNFRRLLEYNNNSMPFASASIGKSYRNEISPRSGLLRVREFLMAEIEHFVDPLSGKKHDRFDEVKHIELALLDRDTQLAGQTGTVQVPIGSAVERKIVDNETLGYFLARVQLFLVKIGIDIKKLRFRQHLANEMAHYACDCWDAELLTSYGWIECVGCADRSAYDLSVHAKRTGEKLIVQEQLPSPLKVERWEGTLEKKKLGPRFRKDAKFVEMAVSELDQESLEKQAAILKQEGRITLTSPVPLADGSATLDIDSDILTIEKVTRIESVREYVPNVIEPSFGIGRILYSLLEQVYWHRPQDSARGVLSLPLPVAPTKVLIVPLSSNTAFLPIVKKISQRLRAIGVSSRADASSASIGKRYARNDELGTPLGITIDFDTVKNGSITLRERDGTKQIRASEDEVIDAVKALVDGTEALEEVFSRLPEFTGQETE